jgi:flagellar hook-associated protein 1 FlgK
MGSTFGLLSTASTGLTAARAGMDVVGQNIANVNTSGYTRQRVETSSVGALANGLLSTGFSVGAGVRVDGISRLGSELLENRVRTTSATSGFWAVQAQALSTLESSYDEPAGQGISAQLDGFWKSWAQLSNDPSKATSASVVLQSARQLTTSIAQGYRDVLDQWSGQRVATSADVDAVNQLAGQVAQLNDQVRITLASGSSANELLDQRAVLTTRLAELAGTSVRNHPDGTVDVVLDGNSLVAGGNARTVRLVGATELSGTATTPLAVEFTDRPGIAIQLDGGRIAGGLAVLAPTAGTGVGGTLAVAAQRYDDLATKLASAVNAIHSTGSTTGGATGLNFFSLTAGLPAALGLTVVPADASGIAAGASGAGAYDGSIADAIAQLAADENGPDGFWTAVVVSTGIAAGVAQTQAQLSAGAVTTARTAQAAETSVDLDEETTQLMTYQRAYQGAARMVSAIDEMLDTLINRTGLVGR